MVCLKDAEYVVSEPQPNNVTQASGNLMIVETAGNVTLPLFEVVMVSYHCVKGAAVNNHLSKYIYPSPKYLIG